MNYSDLFEISEKIKQLYNKGEINNSSIAPLWITQQEQIDFTHQGNNTYSNLITDGYTILSVNLENLLSCFDSDQAKMYRKMRMYNGQQEPVKIGGVIHSWLIGVTLIPPTILCRDSLVSSFAKDSDILFPQDGKHRINVAYCSGAETIPIIVWNKQLDKVKRILNIE